MASLIGRCCTAYNNNTTPMRIIQDCVGVHLLHADRNDQYICIYIICINNMYNKWMYINIWNIGMYYSIIKQNYNKYHLLLRSFTNNSLPLTHIHTHTKSATKAVLFSLPRCKPFTLQKLVISHPVCTAAKAAPGTCRCLARPDRRRGRCGFVALLYTHKYAIAPIRENRSLN